MKIKSLLIKKISVDWSSVNFEKFFSIHPNLVITFLFGSYSVESWLSQIVVFSIDTRQGSKLFKFFPPNLTLVAWICACIINSLTPKSVPAGTKLVLFGRYVLNIYVGIVRYFLFTTKLSAPKSTYRHNAQIGEYRMILTSAKKIRFCLSTHVID